jgi:prepilin-type N-terminal cleavage/methylation domain-containing protein
MKGFTLIEVLFTILILTILFLITFNFSSFNENFLYLKEFSRKLNSAFSVAGFLAQQTKSYQNQIVCAYGVYFPNNTSYETLAFSTSTLACDYVVNNNLQNFLNSNLASKKYVHSNLEIRPDPLPKLALNDTLQGGSIAFSTSTPDCSSDILTPPLLFMYVYSYTDMYFLYQQVGGRWQKITSPSMYLCLNFRNDHVKIKVNQVGQFYIIE